MTVNYKSKHFCLSVALFALALVNCLVYAFADARENSPLIIALLAIVAVCELVLAVKPIPYAQYVPLVLMCVAIACFIPLAFDEIGDILSKINMTGLSASWIISAALLVINAVLAAILSVFDANK